MAEVPHRPATRDLTFCFQKLAGERDALQRELEDLKKKSEGLRSRNKVLSSEVKTLRSQMGTLVEKGRHDDELIDALMVRPSRPGRALARGPAPNSEGAPTWPRNLRLRLGSAAVSSRSSPDATVATVATRWAPAPKPHPRTRSSSEAARAHEPLSLCARKERDMGVGEGSGITSRVIFHQGMEGTTEGPEQSLVCVITPGPSPSGPLGSAL